MKSLGPSARIALAKATPIIALIGLLAITACSSETPSTATGTRKAGATSGGQTRALHPRSGLATAAPPLPDAQRPVEPPTRSELRVMGQQAKGTEAAIKGLIQDFDANLGDPGMRKKTEQAFRSALPEYKAKMLVLGKAKLQGAR